MNRRTITYRPVQDTSKAARSETRNVVYTWHFSAPFKHAMHYTGTTNDLIRRMKEETDLDGSNLPGLLKAAQLAGIELHIGYIAPGGYKTERKLKNRGSAKQWCWICKGEH